MSDKNQPWAKAASKLLKLELLKRDMTYKDLVDRLKTIGIIETEVNIKNKMRRGTFGAIFFLQCLKAMHISTLTLDESLFKFVSKVNQS